MPLKDPSGEKIYDSASKAELFANSMEAQFTENHGIELQEVTRSLEQLEEITTRSRQYTTPKDVWEIIKKLPPAKEPGPDNIPNTALKHLPPLAISHLNNIYTAYLRLSYLPKLWKNATIVMIPKPSKDHNAPKNHRPISLLSTMAKVFERIILSQLQKHIKPWEEQHAFRRGHSTITQLVKLSDELVKSINNKQKTVAIFLNIEKAFDRVWHNGLIHKFHTQTSTPKHLMKLIKSFLSDRSFKIKIQDQESIPKPIAASVP